MLGELVGEFKGKNVGWRVLPDGKIETTAQGTGKLFGMDVFLVSTSVGTMTNGTFMGEVNSVFTTMEGRNRPIERNRSGFPVGKRWSHTSCFDSYNSVAETREAKQSRRHARIRNRHERQLDRKNLGMEITLNSFCSEHARIEYD